jgi:hypothetical protein
MTKTINATMTKQKRRQWTNTEEITINNEMNEKTASKERKMERNTKRERMDE